VVEGMQRRQEEEGRSMVGPYWYLRYSRGKLSKRRSYSRYVHYEYGNEKYRRIGKKRLVRPMYKKGLHRFSRPWKYSQRPFFIISARFNPPLECGYSRNQLWIALCRAWTAFTIYKQNHRIETMQKYGRIIHEIQKKLGIPLTEFNLILGDEYDDDDIDYEGMDDFTDSSSEHKSDEELLAELDEPIYYKS
jgi:hypothetical protein